MREEVKDSRGNKIGYTETGSNNQVFVYDKMMNRIGYIQNLGNKLQALDKMQNRIATYESNTNATYDKMHNKISNGNVLLNLFFQ